MAEQLGQAVLTLKVNDDDLIAKLQNAKKLLGDIDTRPIKLKVDGSGSRTPGVDPAVKAASRAAAEEVKRKTALKTLDKQRFQIARELSKLEARGVEVSRLRSRLEQSKFSTSSVKNSLAEIKAASQTTTELGRQVTLTRDRANESAKAAAAEQILASRGGRQKAGAESITALTDAQKKQFRLEQQIRSLESAGVNTAKFRAQLGEATTAQSRSQFGSFNQIADALDFTLRKEREKLKVLRDQNTAVEKQATAGKRVGRLNASPVRGGIAFDGSPGALAAEQAEGRRIAKLNTSPVRGTVGTPGSPKAVEAERKLEEQRLKTAAATKRAEDQEALRIAKLNASPVRGTVGTAGSPAAKAAQRRADEKAEKERRQLASRGGTQKGRAESLSGREALADKLLGLQNRLNILDAKGVDISKQRLGLQQLVTAANNEQLGSAKQIARAVNAQTRTLENDLQVSNIKAARAKKAAPATATAPATAATPATAAATVPEVRLGATRKNTTNETKKSIDAENKKAAALAKARKSKNASRVNSALVGGAFPLMFGQGGFASAGGLAGGALGGAAMGFGLSLVGTLIGSQVDALNVRFGILAKALQDPIAGLDVFIQNATLASAAQERLVTAQIAAGQTVQAEKTIRAESARTIDPFVATGVAVNTDSFNRALSDTQDILGQLTGGATSEFLGFLADILDLVNNVPDADPNKTPEQSQKELGQAGLVGQLQGFATTAAGLTIAGVGAFLTSLGIGAPVGVPIIATGLGIAGAGVAGTASAANDSKVAASNSVLALEKQVVAALQKQDALQQAVTKARSQGRTELAAQLSVFAELAKIDTDLAREKSVIEQTRVRDQNFVNDDKDQATADAANKEAEEKAKILKALVLDQLKAEERVSALAAERAQALRGLFGTARTIAEKELSVATLRKKVVEAEQNLSGKTGTAKDAAQSALTKAKNDQFTAQIDLEQSRLQIQNDLNKALQQEFITRQGVLSQIKAAQVAQEAALARADFGASPGSSALGARAGAAEGRAFTAQNQQGIADAKRNEQRLKSELTFELDPGKQAELVSKIKTAAEQTRLAYVQAGTALAEKVGQAAASLQGAQASLRGTLESNSNLIPRADRAILKDAAKADIDRGRRTGILREDLRTPGSTRRQFEIANFVRQVEQQRAQIASQQALVEALNNNTLSERSVQITITSDGQGGYDVPQADRQAATL